VRIEGASGEVARIHDHDHLNQKASYGVRRKLAEVLLAVIDDTSMWVYFCCQICNARSEHWRVVGRLDI